MIIKYDSVSELDDFWDSLAASLFVMEEDREGRGVREEGSSLVLQSKPLSFAKLDLISSFKSFTPKMCGVVELLVIFIKDFL